MGLVKRHPEDDDLEAIDEGLAQADAGQLIPFDQIKDWVASWDTPDEHPTPTPESTPRLSR